MTESKDVDESDLQKATVGFFDESDVTDVQYSSDSDKGMVVVDVEEVDAGMGGDDTFDLLDFDEHLAMFGFEHTGYIPAPGMTQVNVTSIGEDE